MPTVFRPSTSKPVTIGDEYRLFKRSSTVAAAPVIPVVDDIQGNATEEKDAETVDADEEKNIGDPKKEQHVEKKRPRGTSDGTDDGPADGEGTQGDASPPESKRSKTAAVPGEGDDVSQVGEGSSSVHAEQEQSGAKQETEEGGGPSTV
jgi:hypothetical protein